MIANYVGGEWVKTQGEVLPVLNPATGEELGRTPMSSRAELDAAVTPPPRRFKNGAGFRSSNASSTCSS